MKEFDFEQAEDLADSAWTLFTALSRKMGNDFAKELILKMYEGTAV